MSVRKIIHVDADSFYAAIEMREDPALASRPIAVGGQPDHRGVIATCNYLARARGVHSAMPSSMALRACPDLIILPPRFELYREVSRQLHAILRQYTALIEPVALDEAYMDVSECRALGGIATRIAEAIRQEVRETLRITVSAGVAPNKFLAKVASDWRKPDGLFVIKPHQVADFVKNLPVGKINGVGPVTRKKLESMGIHTCGDLQSVEALELERLFGRWGARLYQLARGVDNRPVQTSRRIKSQSVERTFDHDLISEARILATLPDLLVRLATRFERYQSAYQPVSRTVKVKFSDFQQTTLEQRLTTQDWEDRAAWEVMLAAAWRRQGKPVRLIGVGLGLAPRHADSAQLSLFEEDF
ncbi:DNA polymerase IV [Hahella sp. SMD15-11]|uniref:DNA polymerase IV n=1 Tax=Thermohahella caldifontis TaxID=3142973 RepID=A0AB39UZB2_9GAMM